MAKRIKSYADTSAFIAFADKSDSHHALFKRLFSEPPALATTTMVVTEGHGWFLKRYDRTRALQFLAMIEEMSFLEIIPTGQRELSAAIVILRKFSDQDLTLVDATGLGLMSARHIRSCWSTDFHLGLTGVPLIVHAH
jgi:predicted nucleic acid-binding protein